MSIASPARNWARFPSPPPPAIASGKPCIFIRNQKKDYGTAKLVEGVLNPGETVLIVEDIMTTGGQVLEACKVLTDLAQKSTASSP